MKTGVEIDPVTQRPKKHEVTKDKSDLEEKKLRKIAADLDIVQSDAGQKTIKLIEGQLQARIEALVNEDEAAKAYLNILKLMGRRQHNARQAVEGLHRRFIGDDE